MEVKTAILPGGWRNRLVQFVSESAEPASAMCLDPHDLVVSKLAARREKDFAFSFALIEAGLVELDTLLKRAAMLPDSHGMHRTAVIDWLHDTGAKARRDH